MGSTRPTDTVAAGPDGVLWNYRSNGKGGLQPRIKIGSGWFGLKNGFTTDWNQDGVFDLIAQWKDGRLSYYQGKPAGGFAPGQVIGSGWGSYQVTGTHGLVTRLTDGRLAYYPIRNGTWGTRIILSGGWGTYSIFR